MPSALNEWNINPDPETLAYHARQKDTNGSHVAFGDFIAPFMEGSSRVIDAGCGAGYPTNYLAGRFAPVRFIGLDQSETLIASAKINCPNVQNFYVDDLTNLSIKYHRIDGVVSLQTFSWMPDIGTPLEQICINIFPHWIAFSSLFYEGEISCQIVVSEPTRPRKSYYNVYSIPDVERMLATYGYRMTDCMPFNIDVDLPQPPNPDIMKTYTVSTAARRLQISGPLMLPWYFLAFERTA